jgi:hypothetical protein
MLAMPLHIYSTQSPKASRLHHMHKHTDHTCQWSLVLNNFQMCELEEICILKWPYQKFQQLNFEPIEYGK